MSFLYFYCLLINLFIYYYSFGFHKMRGTFWVAVRLLTSQEELAPCSYLFVYCLFIHSFCKILTVLSVTQTINFRMIGRPVERRGHCLTYGDISAAASRLNTLRKITAWTVSGLTENQTGRSWMRVTSVNAWVKFLGCFCMSWWYIK